MFIKKHKHNQGQFIPKFPKKYVGSYPIVVRSHWERLMCQWLDCNDGVVEWSSESITIQYYDPVQKKKRRYYPDFFARMKTQKGISEYVIEVKPHKETKPPSKKGKKSAKTKLYQEATYLTNIAKFKAAELWCNKMGYKFKVLTEKQMFRKGKK
jgi:hypothetical protein